MGYNLRQNRGPVESKPSEITRLLRRWREGDKDAEARLFELLMPDLRKMANRHFRNERSGHTLQPTALVNEVFLRLERTKNVEWNDRGHFFAIAATIMRRYLIDYARARPHVELMPLEGVADHVLGAYTKLELAVAVDALLDELEQESRQRRNIVELKFFLGLTDEEAAQSLNLTLHTLQREWARARRWLFERLGGKP
ncbi:MAG TPA: ECF-type sigma factor [Candidatus Saccharimonadales bacterium]|nr:ECF-type sigma factor [Candidatus Saccharimonadales bacterium]